MAARRAPSYTTASLSFRIPIARLTGLAAAMLVAAAAAATGDTLRGRVVDPDGRPVPGAVVAVSGASAAPLGTVTDAAGTFALDGLPGGVTVDVRAWTDGLHAAPLRVTVSATPVELRLVVAAVREALTVTASQVDTPLSLVGDSVTVLTRDDLDARQITTLGDALRLVPGFAVARNGGPGTVTSVFPRGGESDYTLVLVDGVRVNSFGGGLDLSQVPTTAAERIEVVRGPQSALYGSDAIGGVVQVVTPRGGPAVVDALVEAGGRDARRASGTARGTVGRWYGATSAQHMRDDGFTGVAPADGTTVTNDDSRITDVSAGLGWRGDGGSDLFATARYVDGDRGSPGPFGSNPAGNFAGVDRTARSLTVQRSAAIRLLQPLGGAASRIRLRAEADIADFDLTFRSGATSRGETARRHGRLQADAALTAALSASAGGEWVGESGRSTFITGGGRGIPVERDVWAGFAEARWQPSAALSVTAGARASRITRHALAADAAAFSPRPAFADDTTVAVNPRLTAAWTIVPPGGRRGTSTRLHAAAGSGIRPPDAFEIAFTDNDGLEPERSLSVEAGLTQTLANGAVHLDGTWFHNRYDDLIVSVGRFSGSSRYRTDNIANARARGVELALTTRPTRRLTARATYTFLDSEVLAVDGADGQAPPPFRVGDRLLRRPRHQGSGDLVWGTPRLQAFATLAVRGATLDVEPNFGTFGGLFENAGYTAVALGGSWAIVPQLTAFARVVNAFDARYEDALGYPALGRTAYLGLRIAARR
ncbi:MAG: TonB-dependent receptor [Vicinamibacterales bacterium]